MTGATRSCVVPAAALVLLALGAAACSTGPGTDAAGLTAATAPATTGAAIAAATPEPPPAASLRGPDSGPVAGVLGGYVYGEGGSDAPWIPAAGLEAIPLTPGQALEIALDRGAVAGWVVSVATETDVQGEAPRPLATGEGASGGGPIRFAAPPVGRWVLEARIAYAAGLGDGAYYWLLDVSPP